MKWKKFAKYGLVGVGVFSAGHILYRFFGIDTFWIDLGAFLTRPFTIAGWVIGLYGLYKGVRHGKEGKEGTV